MIYHLTQQGHWIYYLDVSQGDQCLYPHRPYIPLADGHLYHIPLKYKTFSTKNQVFSTLFFNLGQLLCYCLLKWSHTQPSVEQQRCRLWTIEDGLQWQQRCRCTYLSTARTIVLVKGFTKGIIGGIHRKVLRALVARNK